MLNRLNLSNAQVLELQGILWECYAQAKEANFSNAQVFFLWSKLDLRDPELLSRVLILARGRVQEDVASVSLFAPQTKIQGIQYLADWVERFYTVAHRMIDDLASQDSLPGREMYPGECSSLSSPVKGMSGWDLLSPEGMAKELKRVLANDTRNLFRLTDFLVAADAKQVKVFYQELLTDDS